MCINRAIARSNLTILLIEMAFFFFKIFFVERGGQPSNQVREVNRPTPSPLTPAKQVVVRSEVELDFT